MLIFFWKNLLSPSKSYNFRTLGLWRTPLDWCRTFEGQFLLSMNSYVFLNFFSVLDIPSMEWLVCHIIDHGISNHEIASSWKNEENIQVVGLLKVLQSPTKSYKVPKLLKSSEKMECMMEIKEQTTMKLNGYYFRNIRNL